MLKRNLFIKHSAINEIFDNSVSNFIEKSPVSEFYREELIGDATGEQVVFYSDPIYLLFNQERLSTLGIDGVKNYLDSLANQSNDPLSELRKNCSDDDLLATIKSRYLQTPSEILAWSRYMSNNVDTFNSLVEEVKQSQQQEQIQTSVAAE